MIVVSATSQNWKTKNSGGTPSGSFNYAENVSVVETPHDPCYIDLA
jgi:hypothetical protein